MNESFFAIHKRTIGILIFFILLISIPLLLIALSNRTDLRQRASDGQAIPVDAVASVGDEFITKDAYDKAVALYAFMLKRNKSEKDISKQALDFLIELRLLKKETEKRGVLARSAEIAEERFQRFLSRFASVQALENQAGTNEAMIKEYFLHKAMKQELKSVKTKWRVVDYLSIRYVWNFSPEPEETAFKEIARRKIEEYHQKILGGLDIREAIKQRCTDPEIDTLPFADHIKIYETTFDGTKCREQKVDLYVSKDTNFEWGDAWLKEVFKLRKGQLSQIIVLDKPAVGMYFIVKVIDEGGDSFSIKEIIDTLKRENNVLTYIQ